MTLDDLDVEPAMFETQELRTLFRLARERISELETGTRLLEKASKRMRRTAENWRKKAGTFETELNMLRKDHDV